MSKRKYLKEMDEDWEDYGKWSDSLPEECPEPTEFGLDPNGDRLVKRGDTVLLFGKYPATVVEDEDVDNDKIKVTKPEAFETEEEEIYADWFRRDDIDKSEDLQESLGKKIKDIAKHNYGPEKLKKKDNNENISESMKRNTRTLNESQMRSLVENMVRKTINEMEIAGLPEEGGMGEEDEMTPEFIANSFCEELEDLVNSNDENLGEVKNALDMVKVEKCLQDPSYVYGWIKNALAKHSEFTTIDDVINYMIGGIREGDPSGNKSFAKVFFTKAARNEYYDTEAMSHKKVIPTALEEAITRRVMKALRNL